jgi:hypothetical protein
MVVCLFVIFLLAIVLSVLRRYTDSVSSDSSRTTTFGTKPMFLKGVHANKSKYVYVLRKKCSRIF